VVNDELQGMGTSGVTRGIFSSWSFDYIIQHPTSGIIVSPRTPSGVRRGTSGASRSVGPGTASIPPSGSLPCTRVASHSGDVAVQLRTSDATGPDGFDANVTDTQTGQVCMAFAAV
jgi:hypothetical protein